MTMAYERRRAIEWAGELLFDLARHTNEGARLCEGSVPPLLAEQALRILRHYPEPWQIKAAVNNDEPLNWWISGEPPRN